MHSIDDFERHCLQLKNHLEADSDEMKYCLEGELLTQYRQILGREIEEVDQLIKTIRILKNSI